MLKLRKIFDQNLFKSLYRNYVSIISINADIVNTIMIKPDDYEDSLDEIKFDAVDGDNNLIKITDAVAKVTKTRDEFHLVWLDKSHDTTITVEVPLSSICRDIEISAKVHISGQIKIDNIPTSKIIHASTTEGRVKLSGLRSEKCVATAHNITLEGVYSHIIDLKSPKVDAGTILIESCQADSLKAEARSVKMQSCYAKTVDIRTTHESLLKNLHAKANIVAAGEVLNTVGFSGSMNAKVNCEHAMLHFAELSGHSDIEIDHPTGIVRAGFANEIVKEATNLHISSTCPIQTKSKEFVVCHKSENEFDVIRRNPDADSSLNMNIKRAKEVHLMKQSWIDSVKFG